MTFYSYKGGTGRTLAVANTAIFLSHFGKRVFLLDLDLEGPGLHFKFDLGASPRIPRRGLVDYMSHHERHGQFPDSIKPYRDEVPLSGSPGVGGGRIDLMPAGAAPSVLYSQTLHSLHLEKQFRVPKGETSAPALEFFEGLKQRIHSEFEPDYLLIDSRTGVSGIGGIAVDHLPDCLVCLGHNSPESLAGTREILKSVVQRASLGRPAPGKVVLALARIPERSLEKEKESLEKALGTVLATDDESKGLSGVPIVPLHSDPELQLDEALRVGSATTPLESALLRDYYKLFCELGMDECVPNRARRTFREIAYADQRESIRPLLMRRLWTRERKPNNLSLMSQRFKERKGLKVVEPEYVVGASYGDLIRRMICRLLAAEGLEKDPLPSKEVRWDLLAEHIRDEIVDFCKDVYWLSENRSHLVEIVQLGWCRYFVTYACEDSEFFEALASGTAADGLSQTVRDLKGSFEDVGVAVMGDTPAASEANKLLSPLLDAGHLVTKGNEKDLRDWLSNEREGPKHKMVVCDSVVGKRIEALGSPSGQAAADYARARQFWFESPVPVGIVYPREDGDWRKKLSKALACSVVELLREGKAWEGPKSVSNDFAAAGLEAFALDDLRVSLMLDLPLEDAIEWCTVLSATADQQVKNGRARGHNKRRP